MLLFEALATAECPVCLMPLEFNHSTGPSPDPSPHKTANDAMTTMTMHAGNASSGMTGGSVIDPGDFRISFAPGVSVMNLADFAPGGGSDHRHPCVSYNSNSRYNIGCGFGLMGDYTGPDGGPDTVPGGNDEGDIVVLACGHFIHSLCLRQLVEFQTGTAAGGGSGHRDPSCPVCRQPVRSVRSEVFLFRPHTRPSRLGRAILTSDSSTGGGEENDGKNGNSSEQQATVATITPARPTRKRLLRGGSPKAATAAAPGAEVKAEEMEVDGDFVVFTARNVDGRLNITVPDDDEDQDNHDDCDEAEKEEEDEITLVATRQVPLTTAYRDLLNRTSRQLKGRGATLKSRESHLQSSLDQLSSDCEEVDRSVADIKERCDVISGDNGSSGGGGGGAEARRLDLLRVAAETRAACDAATGEIAAATRERAEIQRYLESYGRKIARLEDPEPVHGGGGR